MRTALFGATGPTGKFVIEEALRRGHSLSVYTRDARKLQAFDGKLDMVVGTLQDKSAIARCLHGSDAAISALGPHGLGVAGDRPVMHGLSEIIAAMRQLNVRRLSPTSNGRWCGSRISRTAPRRAPSTRVGTARPGPA